MAKGGALQVCLYSTQTDWKAPVIADPIAMNQWFVNLEGVRALAIDDDKAGHRKLAVCERRK